MNIPTLIICLLIAAIVAGIIGRLVKNKKEGRTTCGCDCGGCQMRGSCHKNTKNDQ